IGAASGDTTSSTAPTRRGCGCATPTRSPRRRCSARGRRWPRSGRRSRSGRPAGYSCSRACRQPTGRPRRASSWPGRRGAGASRGAEPSPGRGIPVGSLLIPPVEPGRSTPGGNDRVTSRRPNVLETAEEAVGEAPPAGSRIGWFFPVLDASLALARRRPVQRALGAFLLVFTAAALGLLVFSNLDQLRAAPWRLDPPRLLL